MKKATTIPLLVLLAGWAGPSFLRAQTPTFTFTPTFTQSPTATVTYTPTGCAKTMLSIDPSLPVTNVSGGVTAVSAVMLLSEYGIMDSCAKAVTYMDVHFNYSGNLSSTIQEVQLWDNTLSTKYGAMPFATSVTFTGTPLCSAPSEYAIRLVLAGTAYGAVQAYFKASSDILGYVVDNYSPIDTLAEAGGGAWPVTGLYLQVGSTATPTPAWTMTNTWTPVWTGTPSATRTPTSTPTAVNTDTFTPVSTWTDTPILTSTSTDTVYWTSTASWTFTKTATPTGTWTGTPISSFTPTDTPTETVTPILSATPMGSITETPSETSVATLAASEYLTSAEIVKALAYPNPSTDGATNLYYEISGTTSSLGAMKLSGTLAAPARDSDSAVILRVFTRSGRLLWTHRVQGVQDGSNSYFWEGKDLKNAPLANGLYFYSATLERDGYKVTQSSNIFIMK